MPLALRSFLTLAALACAPVAAAQEASRPADSPEIVVTGARTTEEEIRAFVGAVAPTPGQNQLSRFETRAVCPAMVGAAAGPREAIVNRMRAVAGSADVPVAKAGCMPNVLVIVTRDKKAFIEALRRKQPDYFETLSANQVRRLADEPARAVAWQLAGPQLDADGVEIEDDFSIGLPVNRTGRAGSRITAATRPHFAAAVVVVEGGALDGLTTTQLADYAAMRAFARIDPAQLARSGAPTILKVLDAPMGSAVPVTLTAWDLALLRGLYAAPENLRAPAQRSAIGRRVEEAVRPEG